MDLVERYLQAVRFWLPKSQRQDISAELAEDIRSQVEDQERKLGRSLTEDELASLLKQRGSPFSVAEKYQPQRALVGPGLFPIYAFVLKLAGLVYFIPWLVVWLGLVIFAPAYRAAHPGWSLLGTLGTFWSLAFFSYGMITLSFAVVEQVHRRVKVQGDWNPRRLPSVRDIRKISRFSSLTTAVFDIIFLFWWLGGLKFPVIMLQDKTTWSWTAGPVWQGFHQQMYWPIALLALAAAGLAAYNLFHPSWNRLRMGVRAALNAVGAAVLLLGISAYSSGVQAQWLKMTSAHPGVPTLDAVRIWTNIIVFLSLLLAGIICLLTCLWLLWRVIRWKTLFPTIGRGLATLVLIGLMVLGAFGAQTPARSQTAVSSTPSNQEVRRILVERIHVQHRSEIDGSGSPRLS
jgi:hypothetical protein